MSRAAAALVALALGAATGPATASRITLGAPYPKLGEPTSITVVGQLPAAAMDQNDRAPSSVVVEILYRPNTEAPALDRLPSVQARATAGEASWLAAVSWTPRQAGLVRITARVDGDPAATLDAAVRWGRFPASGLAIMLLSATLLFGGAGLGLLLLLRRGE